MKESRRFPILAAALAGGLLAVLLVWAGAWGNWPNFSPRSGYWGTMFLNSMLYAMGSDRAAMTVISGVWFVYGTVAFGLAAAAWTSRKP